MSDKDIDAMVEEIVASTFLKIINRIAIGLYAHDGFTILAYDTPKESWDNDRESVRETYRTKALQKIIANPSILDEEKRDE